MIRVFVADDHPVVLQGLKAIVQHDPDLELVGAAATTAEARERVPGAGADVLILDIDMPGRGGLDALVELRDDQPDLAVLVLSHHPEDPYGIRAIQSGAAGYLDKHSVTDQLVTAIKRVASGKKYISDALGELLAVFVEEGQEAAPHTTLSHREFQVLTLIARGLTLSEIADELALSVKTISTYRSRLLEKMGLRTNAQLMRYAFEHEIVQ